MDEWANDLTEAAGSRPAVSDGGVTRRGLLGGAAGGLFVLGLSKPAAAAGAPSVGTSQTDRHSIGLVGVINQDGVRLTGVGFLTRVRGLRPAAIYRTAPATSSSDPRASDPAIARFTYVTRVTVETMSRVGDVITAVATGTSQFFYRPQGGASFDDPRSFGAGRPVAAFAGSFKNDLVLDGENQGLIVISADMIQQSAHTFVLGGRRYRFGAKGLPWSMRSTGRGHRTEPTTPRAQLFHSGEMGVIDAASAG